MVHLRVLALAALLLLAPVARADDSLATIAASESALAARFAPLREALEAELGAAFDPAPRFVPATHDELARLLAGESEVTLAGLEHPPYEGEVLTGVCAQQGRALATWCFGKLHLAEGHVLIHAGAFASIARLAPELAGVADPACLDVILIHEAVHVWQDRRFGVRAVIGQPRTEEELRARQCVIEGHAQVITRRVAERLGLDEAFASFVRANSGVPSTVTDPAARQMAEAVASMLSLQYVEGERFVAAVMEALGPEAALERLFTSPPGTLGEVSRPDDYLSPPGSDGVDLTAAARAMGEHLPPWPQQVVAVPAAVLRSGLALAGDEAEAWLNDDFREAACVVASDPGTPGRQLVVVLIRCASPEAAVSFRAIEEAVSRKKDELLAGPEGQVVILEAAYEDAPLDGARPCLFIDKKVRTAGETIALRIVVGSQGPFVFEVMAVHATAALDKVALQDLARHALGGLEPR